jgi:hypothetical protein
MAAITLKYTNMNTLQNRAPSSEFQQQLNGCITKNPVKKCCRACHLAPLEQILQDFFLRAPHPPEVLIINYSPLPINAGKTTMIVPFFPFQATIKDSSSKAKLDGVEKKQQLEGGVV